MVRSRDRLGLLGHERGGDPGGLVVVARGDGHEAMKIRVAVQTLDPFFGLAQELAGLARGELFVLESSHRRKHVAVRLYAALRHAHPFVPFEQGGGPAKVDDLAKDGFQVLERVVHGAPILRAVLGNPDQNPGGQLALGTRNVQVGHCPNDPGPECEHEHPPVSGPRNERRRIRRTLREREDHDVGLDRLEVDRNPAALRKMHRERPGMRVVFSQTVELMVERVEPGGGKDPDLPHGATEPSAVPCRADQDVARAGQQRSSRRSQSFGEGDADQVEWGSQLSRSPAGRDGGVPETCPVQIGQYVMPGSGGADPIDLVLWEHHAAGTVVRVFQPGQRRWRIEQVTPRLSGGLERFGGEESSLADFGQLDARVGRGPTGFVPRQVALPHDDDVVTGPSERPQSDLVGHRSAGQPQRAFLAEERRDAFLQCVYGGIFTELVVTNRCGRNRRPHSRRRTRDGVRAQIDRGRVGHGCACLRDRRCDTRDWQVAG